MMAVIFEHRAAAGHVDDHRVDIVGFKCFHVLVGHLSGRFARSGMKMDRSAALLLARHEHVAPVLL